MEEAYSRTLTVASLLCPGNFGPFPQSSTESQNLLAASKNPSLQALMICLLRDHSADSVDSRGSSFEGAPLDRSLGEGAVL